LPGVGSRARDGGRRVVNGKIDSRPAFRVASVHRRSGGFLGGKSFLGRKLIPPVNRIGNRPGDRSTGSRRRGVSQSAAEIVTASRIGRRLSARAFVADESRRRFIDRLGALKGLICARFMVLQFHVHKGELGFKVFPILALRRGIPLKARQAFAAPLRNPECRSVVADSTGRAKIAFRN